MKSLLLAALGAAALLPAAALADDPNAACTTEPQSAWLSVEAITQKALDAGYKDIRNVKIQGTCYEVYAFAADGDRTEILMNPVDGTIASDEDDD